MKLPYGNAEVMDMRRVGELRIRPLAVGELLALGLVIEALALDVLLLKRRQDVISTCVRRSMAGRIITVYLAAHLTLSIPFDPLKLLGNRVSYILGVGDEIVVNPSL